MTEESEVVEVQTVRDATVPNEEVTNVETFIENEIESNLSVTSPSIETLKKGLPESDSEEDAEANWQSYQLGEERLTPMLR